MEKQKAVNFLRNTGLEPLEKHKAADVGHHRTGSESPFKWRFAGGLIDRMWDCRV